MATLHPTLLLLAPLLGACAFDEVTGRTDLTGTIRLPKEAITITLVDPDTEEQTEVVDPRVIGPVYIGVFPSVQADLFDYLHPEMGPIVDADNDGNTYPYGGTSVGHFKWGCYEELRCKLVTGRFTSYEDILSFFADSVGNPVNAPSGEEVGSGEEYQEACFDALEVTADYEVGIIVDEDDDPDFTEDGDDYVADVEILNVAYQEGMQVWGWIDMPSSTFDFSTCSPDDGPYYYEYDQQYYQGTNYPQLLNYPSNYISDGDWIASTTPTITSEGQDFEMTIGYKNEE